MSALQPFTPISGAFVTAAVGAASITVPTPPLGATSHQLMIQVAAGANAAFSLLGTAEAPDGTPDTNAIPLLGGNAVIWTIPPGTTAISYIRVGGTDATVYFTWGHGE